MIDGESIDPAVDSPERALVNGWRRFGTHFFDLLSYYAVALILMLLVLLLTVVFRGWQAAVDLEMSDAAGYAWAVLLYICFYTILEATTAKTPGKFLFGTMVVDRNGRRPTFLQCFRRTLGRLIPLDALTFFGDNSRGWHDRLSSTYVVADPQSWVIRNLPGWRNRPIVVRTAAFCSRHSVGIEQKLCTLAISALAFGVMIWAQAETGTEVAHFAGVHFVKRVGISAAYKLIAPGVYQLLAALICLIPLKLTRTRLSLLDLLLVSIPANFLTAWDWICGAHRFWNGLSIAASPIIFAVVFWLFRNVPPHCVLREKYREEQPVWLRILLTSLVAVQLSPLFVLLPNGAHLSAALLLLGVALAVSARVLSRKYFYIPAFAVFAFNVLIWTISFPHILPMFTSQLSC